MDWHCHVDLYPDPRGIVKECVARDLLVLSVTNAPSAWAGTSSLGRDARCITTALGLHPQLAHQRHRELRLFEELVTEVNWVGEVGLDGSPEFLPHWDHQMKVFEGVLRRCTDVGGRAMSLHSRQAATKVLDILQVYPKAGTPILHWFSGSLKDLKRADALGCWFSVGPIMLRGARGRLLVGNMPRERVVVESDGPFAQINGSPLMPWESWRAVDDIARVWNTPVEETRERIRLNLSRLIESTG